MSVRGALLALLSEGPKYGLQLRQEFEARTGEVWPLNVGQVYTTLQRLERDGMVESDDAEDGPQRGYRITPAGTRELTDWLQTPPDLEQPPRDELLIKVLVATQVPGIDVHEVVQVHRRHLVEVMQRYTAVKADAGEARFWRYLSNLPYPAAGADRTAVLDRIARNVAAEPGLSAAQRGSALRV